MPLSNATRHNVAELRRMADEMIDGYRSDPAEHSNLWQRMMKASDPDAAKRLPRTVIRDQVLTFLIAGHETSAGTLTFALHPLADRPEVVELSARSRRTRHPRTESKTLRLNMFRDAFIATVGEYRGRQICLLPGDDPGVRRGQPPADCGLNNSPRQGSKGLFSNAERPPTVGWGPFAMMFRRCPTLPHPVECS
ncbi:cytochrome P450, partial [Nocardia goodfellowii]